MTTSILRRANSQNWFYGLLAIVVILAVALPLYLTTNVANQNTRNIRELACILISQTPDDPAKPIIHDFRVKYHCPPFNKAAVGHLTVPTVTRTTTAPAKPAPTRTRVVPMPTTVPGGVRTVVVPGPTRTVTRVRTRIMTRTVAPPSCLQLHVPPCVIQPVH